VSFSIAVVNDSVTLPLAVPGGLSVDRHKGDGGGKQPAISWDKPISVVRLNFVAKTFCILQYGREKTCCATLLVERKPNDALRFLFDNHFWQKAIQEWIYKLLSVRKAVDGWSGLEEYGKRMKWRVKQVFSTPQKDGTMGRGTIFGTTFGLPSSVVEDKEVAPVPKLIRQVHSGGKSVVQKENNPGGGGEGSNSSITVFDSPPEDNEEEEEEEYNKGEGGKRQTRGRKCQTTKA
jgi:hypothetical protein